MGHAIQMWSLGAWSLTAKKNTLTENAGGILIATEIHGKGAEFSGKTFHIPTGSASYNNFEKNTFYGFAIADLNADGAAVPILNTKAIKASTGSGSDYDLNLNYWGHYMGPQGIPALVGQGVVVSPSKVTLTTFLSCIDTVFCENNAGCAKTTSLLDPKTSKCI